MVKPTDPRGYQPGDTGTEPHRNPQDRPMTDRPLEGTVPPAGGPRHDPYREPRGYAGPPDDDDYRRGERRNMPRVAVSRLHHQAAVSRVSWGALFAGLVTAVVLQILFTTLGMAIGLSTLAVNPNLDRGVGIGAGVWWLITGLISLFAAGWVAARVAGIPDHEDAAIHGFITWGLATLFGAFMVTNTVGTLIGGTMGMLNNQLANLSPQTTQQLQQEWNQWQDQGDQFPPQQNQAGQAGQPDRIIGPSERQQVRQATEDAAEVSAPALWMTFLALLLGAGCAIGGALVGTPRTTTAMPIGT